MLSDGADTYGYDAEGRLTSIAGGPHAMTLEYDGFHRLTKVSTSGSALGNHVVTYSYDAMGLMTSRTEDGVTSHLVWTRNTDMPMVLEELDDAGNVVVRNVLADGVIGRVSGGATSYLHHDRLGSVRLVTGSAGNVLSSHSYSAYGEIVAGALAGSGSYGFAGERHDAVTGFLYLRARHHAPRLGRFLTVDPELPTQRDRRTYHRYAYGANNPVMFVDPSGRCFSMGEFSAASSMMNSLNSINVNLTTLRAQQMLSLLGMALGVGRAWVSAATGSGKLFSMLEPVGAIATGWGGNPVRTVLGINAIMGAEVLVSTGYAAPRWWANAFMYLGVMIGGQVGPGGNSSAYTGPVLDIPVWEPYPGMGETLTAPWPMVYAIVNVASMAAAQNSGQWGNIPASVGAAYFMSQFPAFLSLNLNWSSFPTEKSDLGSLGALLPHEMYQPWSITYGWRDWGITCSVGWGSYSMINSWPYLP
ncbi:MAG: RHS repeat-associated core domain-containing protein [Polyangiaceae bacterium]